MITVRVCNKTLTGSLVEKGRLECRGIRVKQPDGSVRVETDHKGQPVREELTLHPPGVVSPQTAVRISQALAAGQVRGQIDGVEWYVFS
ncbi:MAG: hypothetical protein L0Z62_24785 [Gemmataceae bacterium]|nr:hypothetical protein [Gemmataceae bacterium]